MAQTAAFAGTRPLLREERQYLEGVLRAETALPRALVFFLAALGAEVLLLAALLLADHPGQWASLGSGAAIACVGLAAVPAWLRRRLRRELEPSGVMTISGVLEGSAAERRLHPRVWPTFLGPVPVRFPLHWPALPVGEAVTVEAFPFPEIGRRRLSHRASGRVERSFFVLSARGGHDLASELASGELQAPRPTARPLLPAVLALAAAAAFYAIASLDVSVAFFLSPRYPLDVLRSDRGLHEVPSVADARADEPRRGRSLSIASAWLNPEGCLVDVSPDDLAQLRAIRERTEAALPAEADEAADSAASAARSADACRAAREDLGRLFRSQCSRGMRASGEQGPSSAVCAGDDDDVAGGEALRALDALATGMQHPTPWLGIVTGVDDGPPPRPSIHLGWRHHAVWIGVALALHGAIGVALLTILGRSALSLCGAARRRRLSAAAR